MTSTELLQILTGFLGALGFAILFNIRGKKLIFSALGGFLSWALFVLFKYLTLNEPIRYFLVAVLISVYAEILARLLKTPTTTFVISSLIPLIPGGSLYYTMSSAFRGDVTGFLDKGLATLQLAVALALGIVLNTATVKMTLHTIEHFKRKRQQ